MADHSPVLTSGNWTHEVAVKAIRKKEKAKIFRAHVEGDKGEN